MPDPIPPSLVARLLLFVASGAASGAAVSSEPAPAGVESAAAAPDSRTEFAVQSLRPGLHLVSGAGGNVAVWSGADAVVLVDDAVAGAAADLLQAVARIDPRPVRFVLNTHWHPDHTGGNERIARTGGIVVAHENTRSRMSTEQFAAAYDRRVPPVDPAALPVVTLAEQMSLHLNGDRLDALHVVAAHTDGDVIVWWNDANVVHMGGVMYGGGFPFVDRSSGGSLVGIVAAIEGVLSRADEGTIVIPGHGPPANRADLARYRDMLVAVGRRVRELVEQGRSVEEVLDVHPTAPFDATYGQGALTAERFVRILYEDLAAPR